jgi:hypothetical protein
VTLKTAISAEHAEAYGSMPSFVLIAEMCFNIGWRRLAQAVSRHKQSDMEVMSFLKAVPAVIGIAGLLTYFVRARKPESDLELANIVQRVRNTFLLLGCAALILLSVWLIRRPAPPDHDTVSPLANVSTTISNDLL